MDLCVICGTEVGARSKVCCSGVCGKLAHTECLNIHQLHYEDWICSTDCQKFDERYKQLVKQAIEDNSSRFTAKILRVILENLSTSQLANARLVCHLWKRVIDRSPSLMDKLVLNFPRGSTLDKHCDPVRTLAASTLRFTRAYLKRVTIVGATSWWPVIGGRLNSLIVTDCKISIEILLDILKATPGLKRLELNCGKHFFCRTIPSIDFKLQALEELFLAGIPRVELLDVFVQICPRLRVLSIPGKYKFDGYNEKLLSFIKRVRMTLEMIEISGEMDFFDKLTDMSGLLLKRVILGSIDQQNAVYLSGTCPTLESISIARTKFNDVDLAELGDNLPKLKTLAVKIVPVATRAVTFLNFMPSLSHLSLKSTNDPIKFGTLLHPNLTSLALQYAKQEDNWFQHFPNLRIVKISNCTIAGGWSNVLAPVAQLRRLQRLKLDNVSVENASEVEYLPEYLDSLTMLEIRQCELPKQSLLMLFSYCPKLSLIRLEAVKGVDDDAGEVIGQNGEYLKEIYVQCCDIHDSVFEEHVTKNGRAVKLYLYDNIQEVEDIQEQAEDEHK